MKSQSPDKKILEGKIQQLLLRVHQRQSGTDCSTQDFCCKAKLMDKLGHREEGGEPPEPTEDTRRMAVDVVDPPAVGEEGEQINLTFLVV